MIHILYSNDYELFLGKNFASEHEILIRPTEELLKTCEGLQIPLTSFCDVACLWRYREAGLDDFPAQAESQLRDMIRRKHDVQTHLHPHWLSATREGTQWKWLPSQFTFGGGTDSDESCRQLAVEQLRRAADYLEKLLKPVDKSYRCVAYRAGGFGLQPRDRQVIAALIEAGYLVDSSVVPGLVLKNEYNAIDFSNVPALANYHLSAESGLSRPSSSGIFEIPIASAEIGRISRMRDFYENALRRLKKQRDAWESFGASAQSSAQTSLVRRMCSKVAKLSNRHFVLELRYSHRTMLDVTRSYLDRHLKDKKADIYFSLIIHSKNVSDRLLESLCRYHEALTREYGRDIQAKTYRQTAGV